MLRRLLPDPAGLALDELYDGLTLPATRAGWVALCLVSSVDGSITVEGRSGGLGGEADLLALSRLRGSNDVSVVGAGTVRAERYGPLVGSARRREDRASRGLAPVPRIAIVSASGRLEPDLPVFGDPDQPPLLFVGAAADAGALARLEGRAEIHACASEWVSASEVVDTLVSLGLHRIVCEGGARLNHELLAADRVDEVFLTVAPMLVGGEGPRVTTGPDEHVRELRLVSAYEHEDELLLRYRHRRHAADIDA